MNTPQPLSVQQQAVLMILKDYLNRRWPNKGEDPAHSDPLRIVWGLHDTRHHDIVIDASLETCKVPVTFAKPSYARQWAGVFMPRHADHLEPIMLTRQEVDLISDFPALPAE